MKAKLANWLRKEIRIRPLRKRSTPSPLVRKLGLGFQILFLTLLCSFLFWRFLIYLDVSRQFAQIRSARLPTSGAELNAWLRSVPDADNGALILTQAFALIRAFPDNRSNSVIEPGILSRTNIWTAETRALVQAYVETNQPALIKAQEGIKLGIFRYPADFSFGPDTELPHLRELKTLARIAALHAVAGADGGQVVAWPGEVELLVQLARTLDSEPTIISQLVRNAILRLAVKTTQRSLNRAPPEDGACKRLQEALAHAAQTNLLPQAFIGERAITIPIFRLSWQEIQRSCQNEEQEIAPPQPQRYSGKPNPLLWLTGFFERDLNFFMATMAECASRSELPSPKNLSLTNYLDSANDKAQRRGYFFSSMLLPSYSRIVVRNASTRAHLEVAETALAVERFRVARHRLPKHLAELVPEFLDGVPADPFDGSPLRYRVLKQGYVVYSIDADGRDDGGREPPERKKKADESGYDITFIVESSGNGSLAHSSAQDPKPAWQRHPAAEGQRGTIQGRALSPKGPSLAAGNEISHTPATPLHIKGEPQTCCSKHMQPSNCL